VTKLKEIVVIGGTGAFGARLCDVLTRDGHRVTVATRTKPNDDRYAHILFDRDKDLDDLSGFDVVVDAAGPFHAYGEDPYRIARAAIDNCAYYFDLSDNADFCEGISGLSNLAKEAGVAVVSGMSSVPAVSSAAVTALCCGQQPLMISSAILPGNKAPRGRSVVESILNQVGLSYNETQGGTRRKVRSWSDPKTYELGGITRQGWRIEVPDQRLFPTFFKCPTVTFRAGLELGVMRYGLGALAWLRGHLKFPMKGWMIDTVMFGARILSRFGTDKGGMVVEVTLPTDEDPQRFETKTWAMLATKGDGPYTPAIAVRAVCRDLSDLPLGAYPALGMVTLNTIETCFEDLNITTSITQKTAIPPFQTVLGDKFVTLDPVVQATHAAVTPRGYSGSATVMRGTGVIARVAALLFGFPPSGQGVSVTVRKEPIRNGECWVRTFGEATFKSHLTVRDGKMWERFGPMSFELDLMVNTARLEFPVKRGRICGIPIPRILLPISEAMEFSEGDRFHFDVQLKTPMGGLLIHYRGWLEANSTDL